MQAMEQDYESIFKELGKMASSFSRQGSVSEEPVPETKPVLELEPPKRAPICEILEMIDEDLDLEPEIGDSNPRVPDAAENGLGPEAAQQPHQPFAITISEPPQQQQQPQQQQEEEPEQQQQPKQGSNHVAAKVSN